MPNGHGEKRSRKQEMLISTRLTTPTVTAAVTRAGVADATTRRRSDMSARDRQTQEGEKAMCRSNTFVPAVSVAPQCPRGSGASSARWQNAALTRTTLHFREARA